MARSTESNTAISRKIAKLVKEGFPQKQATAIAFRMYRSGEIKPVKKKTTKKAPKKPRTSRTTRTTRTTRTGRQYRK